MPLFWGDARHAGKPGNRCKLHIRHLVLLTTMCTYTAAREDAMEPWFGVDQSNISRYLDLGYRILGEMTATADFMTSLLKKCKTVNDIREIIPDLRILVDGTHIERGLDPAHGDRFWQHSIHTHRPPLYHVWCPIPPATPGDLKKHVNPLK